MSEKKKKKQSVVKPSIDKKRISKGQKRYMLASDIQESADSYESQAQEEAEKAEKRSLWSTVGGVLGAGIGIMAAPLLIPVGATLATTGIITGIAAGGASYAGGKAGKASQEKRKDIKVDKFYTKAAEEATDTFKEYDKNIDKSIRQQAIVSGALAGLQAGGAFKKAGEWAKKGLGVGDKAGAMFDSSLVTASDIGGTGGKSAYLTTEGAGAQADLVGIQGPSVDVTSTAVRGAPTTSRMIAPSSGYSPSTLYDTTSAFGPASNENLYSLLKRNIGQNLISSGIGIGKSVVKPRSLDIEKQDEINLPRYT